MQKLQMSNYDRLILKRKAKRKKRIRNFIIFLLIVFVALCGVLLHNFKNSKDRVLNVKTTTPPDYVDVQLISNSHARTGVKLIEINSIVIHYTGNPETTAQNNRDYFNKPDTNVCSHFVIGLNGEVIQCVPIDEKSAASNNRNLDTISIEVCHPDKSGKFNTETYNSLVKLTAWLCDNSSLKASDVIRHYDITGKECPKYFVDNQSAWNTFLNDVKKELKNY